MQLVGYTRVSVSKADSLEAQREAIYTWATSNGHHVIAFTEDEGKSGTLDAADRPGLLEALKLVEDGEAKGLVVHRLDRLARALHVQEAVLAVVWKEGGRVFEVAGEVLEDDPNDPMRTAMRQMRGVFGQLERGMVRARMQGGRARKMERGGYVGGYAKYGYRIEGQGEHAILVPVAEEQRVIKRVRAWRRRGWTLRKIAARLAADGVPARRGHWAPSTVRNLVAS
jgi:DNA invertase Pin-like site-specific DNA recombinase